MKVEVDSLSHRVGEWVHTGVDMAYSVTNYF
jgi:hypothetical protein